MGCIVSEPLTAPELYATAAGFAGASLSIDRTDATPALPVRQRPVPWYANLPEEPTNAFHSKPKITNPTVSREVLSDVRRHPQFDQQSRHPIGQGGSFGGSRPDTNEDEILWKRVGAFHLAAPPRQLVVPRPPLLPDAARSAVSAGTGDLARATAAELGGAEEVDCREGVVPLTRAISSFGQNRTLETNGTGPRA